MAKAKTTSSEPSKRIRPALSPEARENQLIALAIDRAEQQLIDGTASSQVITHFLKLATAKAQLEKEKLTMETKLLEAKTENLQSMARMEEMYADAIAAMREYGGHGGPSEEDWDDD